MKKITKKETVDIMSKEAVKDLTEEMDIVMTKAQLMADLMSELDPKSGSRWGHLSYIVMSRAMSHVAAAAGNGKLDKYVFVNIVEELTLQLTEVAMETFDINRKHREKQNAKKN